MLNWVTLADLLRQARQSQEDWLVREWVDRTLIGPLLLDRVAADLHGGINFTDFADEDAARR